MIDEKVEVKAIAAEGIEHMQTSTTYGEIELDHGTINPIYKPEWTKVESMLDRTNQKLSVTVKGSAYEYQEINENVTIDYASDVGSTLSPEDITVYINGVEVTNTTNPKITIGEITRTENATSGKSDVTQTITLSNLEEAVRQAGMAYKEWSGNVSIKIEGRGKAQSTYEENVLTDQYGNQNMAETDENGTNADGTWIDITFEDAETDQNTDGVMFIDFVKPEFTYIYSDTDIDYEGKKLTVVFSAVDKYFASSTLTVNDLTILIDGQQPTWKAEGAASTEPGVTRTLTSEEITEERTKADGTKETVTIGYKYTLTLSNLQQDPNNAFDYSGIVTVAIPGNKVTDKSGNTNNGQTITVGVDAIGNDLPTTDTTMPYLPTGYTYLEGNLETGLVIADGLGNEYVWVEVPRTEGDDGVYKTAGLNITEFTADDYTKIENDLKTYTSAYRDADFSDEYADGKGLTSEEYTKTKQKTLKSIYTYGGFYVGRYEAGTDTARKSSSAELTTAVIKQNAYPYNYVTNAQAQELASEMTEKLLGYQSNLMFGVQWDLVLKYLETKATEQGSETIQDELITDSTNFGNYINSLYKITNENSKYSTNNGSTWAEGDYEKTTSAPTILTTGANEAFNKQRIYDLAGNVSEWTLENFPVDGMTNVPRGGTFMEAGTDSQFIERGVSSSTAAAIQNGFRIALIKDPDPVEELPSTDFTQPYLPEGYEYREGDLDTGLVIADPLGNEYVWVEVPKKSAVYPTAGLKITGFTDDDYTKIENDLKTYTSAYGDANYSDTYADGKGITSDEYTKLKNKTLKSIYTYGGFYVGRYEAGTQTVRTSSSAELTTALIQQHLYPYNYVTNAQAQSLANGFASNLAGYESGLMFGVQWDLVLKHMETKAVEKGEDLATVQASLKTSSLDWGNYYDSTFTTSDKAKYSTNYGSSWSQGAYTKSNPGPLIYLSTGAATKFCRQGIYDFAGNMNEHTLETYSGSETSTSVERGSFVQALMDAPAVYRWYGSPTSASIESGFRVTLIKDVDAVMPKTQTTKPYLPDGYSYKEGNLDTGLVITDGLGNEYVWVEVPRTAGDSGVYKTAGLEITEFTEEEYTKIETDLKTYTSAFREEGYDDIYADGKGLTSDQYSELKQKTLRSIYTYGGFYVGRYEAGTETARTSSSAELTTAVIKPDVYPYNWVTNAQAQELASDFASNKIGYESNLLFGLQWDLMLKHMQTKGTDIADLNSDSTEWGNYANNTYTTNASSGYSLNNGMTWGWGSAYNKTEEGSILLSTGASSEFEKEGIFDVAGNVIEWTLSARLSESDHSGTYRGGVYVVDGAALPASRFTSGSVDDSIYTNGFRVALIKDAELDVEAQEPETVDVVDPIWELVEEGTDTRVGTVKIRAKDKYYKESKLEPADITVYINGEEIEGAVIDLTSEESTEVRETVSGVENTLVGREYTLKISGITTDDAATPTYISFTPTGDTASSIIGTTQYRQESGGMLSLKIAESTIADQSGNENEETNINNIGIVDITKPEVYDDIQKTQNPGDDKVTIIFNVTDRYYDPSDLITLTEDKNGDGVVDPEISLWMDGVQIDSLLENATLTPKEIWGVPAGSAEAVILGHQYTLEISDFTSTVRETGKDYLEYSGTLEVKIEEDAAKDLSGNNLNTDTTTISYFVDYIKPELRYTHSADDINKTDKTYTMTFEVTDKYYKSGKLTLDNLTIKMQNGQYQRDANGDYVLDANNNKIPLIYDLVELAENGEIDITFNGVPKYAPDGTKVTDEETGEIITIEGDETYQIGHTYTLTIEGLEQSETLIDGLKRAIIKDGYETADYSGAITVAIDENIVKDRTLNSNNGATISAGVSIQDGTESGEKVVVDVVDPVWRNTYTITSDSTNDALANLTMTLKATDTYFQNSTLTEDNITIIVNGEEYTTGITKTVTAGDELTEDRIVNGVVQTGYKYGQEYDVTIEGLPLDVNQVKIQLSAGLITDQNGNSSRQGEFMLYNVLKSTAEEKSATSPFLGETLETTMYPTGLTELTPIAREDIEKVIFVDNIEGSKATEVQRVWDVSAQGDNSIIAWTSQTSAPYTVYIGSNYRIYGNRDSSYLFAYIGYGDSSTATEILGNLNILQTRFVTNMQAMFYFAGYRTMTNLDLGKLSTIEVTNMRDMFNGCGYNAMTSFSLGQLFFATSVTDASFMFANFGYKSLTSFSLPQFAFSINGIENMSWMFAGTGYESMTSMDLSNFGTANVTDAEGMFAYCGHDSMTNLNLGTSFFTFDMTNMSRMFAYCGYTAMTSLDLGDGFVVTNVTDMTGMFEGCGQTAMTVLDLGPAFNKIVGTDFITNCGKEGEITIYAPEAIYANQNAFKLNSTSTSTVDFSRGTIIPIYRPMWTKTGSSLDLEAKTMTVTLEGSATKTQVINDDVTINYSGTLTADLQASDITVYINGVEVTNTTNPTVVINSGTTTTPSIVLSNLEEATRQAGIPFKEWSGNVKLKIGGRGKDSSTYDANVLVDQYGNQSMMQTDENGTNADGTWIDVTFSDLDSPTNINESGRMFADYVKPEFTYKYLNTTIGDGNHGDTKVVTIIFDVVDKYFKESALSTNSTASLITVKVDDEDVNSNITKSLSKKTLDADETDANGVTYKTNGDIYYTVNGVSQKIGERYELVITGLDKGNGYTYSGPMTLAFGADVAKDLSDNGNIATTITIGIDEPGNAKPSDLYAIGGLQIGDFVNYDAGTWTEEEIAAIQTGLASSPVTANGSTDLPSTAFQFGGFTAGSSRNGNATERGTDSYVKDQNGNDVTGWRVFDIEDDGTVILVSAGNTEDYYHPNVETNGQYISEYILTGTVNSNWTDADTSVYQKRDWSNYINTEQKAKSATMLTQSKLDSWYSKYIAENSNILENSHIRKIYEEPYLKYQNIVDNYTAYWIGPYRSWGYYLAMGAGRGLIMRSEVSYGIRVLVTLDNSVLFSTERAGTKTLSGGHMDTYGGAQTYNVWNIVTDPKEDTPAIVDVVDPIWEKDNIVIDKENQKVTVDLIARDKYMSSEATELEAGDIRIFVDGTEMTSSSYVNASLSEPTVLTENRTVDGETVEVECGVKYTLTISDWQELARADGKSYKEWSGPTKIIIAADTAIDQYGNKSNETEFDLGHIDVIKPEFTYEYAGTSRDVPTVENPEIDYTNKTLTVVFTVADKYYYNPTDAEIAAGATNKLVASDLTVIIDGEEITTWKTADAPASDPGVVRTLTDVPIIEQRTDASGTSEDVTVGYKYTLVLSNLEQLDENGFGDGFDFSGVVTIGITANKVKDSSNNVNNAQTITVGVDGTTEDYVSPSVLFDADGSNVDGLHIGDFVNYDAGTWTQEEIDAIQVGPKDALVTANGSTDLPTEAFQFGGFTEGSSRNGNATLYNTYYNYIKDSSTGEAVTGWRVFDIDDDGKVTLISAGNPEDYKHRYGYSNGYISEYILTGNVNTYWTDGDISLYQKRDWSNYINTMQKAESATVLSKSELDRWYSKYITADANTKAEATFKMIYEEPYLRYQNIVDNGASYQLGNSFGDRYNILSFNPSVRFVDNWADTANVRGVRVLVTLSPDVLFSSTKTGSTTLSGRNMNTYGGAQTYNIWNIEGSEGTIVDVVDPVWELVSADLEAATITIKAQDKYFDAEATELNPDEDITVYVGTEESETITKTIIAGPTAIENGVQYTIKLGNLAPGEAGLVGFVPTNKDTDSLIVDAEGKAHYRFDNAGEISIEIAANTAKDQSGNGNKATPMQIGKMDATKPEVFDIQKTLDETEKTVTFTFNVTDKNYDVSDLITLDVDKDSDGTVDPEITAWIDDTQLDSLIENATLTSKEIKAEVDSEERTVGHQYTLVITVPNETSRQSEKDYLEYSGTVKIKIDEDAAKDLAGNTIKPETTTITKFADFLKPDLKYTHGETDISTSSKTYTMTFDVTDKYYTSGKLTIDDLTIKMQNGQYERELVDGVWQYKTDADGNRIPIVYDLKTEPVTIRFSGDNLYAPVGTKVTNSSGAIETVETAETYQIGHRYTLTIEGLEQLDIAEDLTTLDYSGIITVAVAENAIKDRGVDGTNATPNGNVGTTVTTGVNVEAGIESGTATPVDVVDPKWDRVSYSANVSGSTGTATITFNGTDTYFDQDTLTADEIKVVVNGIEITDGITRSNFTTTPLYEERIVNGVNTPNVQYGNRYALTISGFDPSADQVKIRIPKGEMVDKYENDSEVTDMIVYNVLKKETFAKDVTSEDAKTGAFLGESLATTVYPTGLTELTPIARQDIEQVIFVNGISGSSAAGVARVWDVSAQGDKSILAWTSETTAPYTVYVGSEHEIHANKESSHLFAYIGSGDSCDDVTAVDGLDKLKTQYVTHMDFMFRNFGTKAMTALDLGSFNTGAVQSMIAMFYNCGTGAMGSLDLGDGFDTINVTDMSYMFANCGTGAMTILDLSTAARFITSNVTNMNSMFAGCGASAMTKLKLSTAFDTSDVKYMNSMFAGCGATSLSSLDLGDYFYTSNVTDMTSMFAGCGATAMTTLDLGPAFTSIAAQHEDFMTDCGKPNALTIHSPEAIYESQEAFKATKISVVLPSTDYTTPYLPSGFTPVAGTDLSNGFTVQDPVGNQYVWVEVPKTIEVYPTAGLNITDFSVANCTLIENDLHTYTATYRESGYEDTWYSEEQHGFADADAYNEHKYNMLKSVYQNGGFYVGKYETGIADSEPDVIDTTVEARTSSSQAIADYTPVIQANAYPYNYVTNKQAQELASTKFDGGGYTTSLMFGVQWDLILKHIETKAVEKGESLSTIQSALKTDSTEWGNYYNNTYNITDERAKYYVSSWKDGTYEKTASESVRLSTGASDEFCKQGIYDLAGNVREWSLEKDSGSSYPCVGRGGYCSSYGYNCPASYHGIYSTSNSDGDLGFRVALY